MLPFSSPPPPSPSPHPSIHKMLSLAACLSCRFFSLHPCECGCVYVPVCVCVCVFFSGLCSLSSFFCFVLFFLGVVGRFCLSLSLTAAALFARWMPLPLSRSVCTSLRPIWSIFSDVFVWFPSLLSSLSSCVYGARRKQHEHTHGSDGDVRGVEKKRSAFFFVTHTHTRLFPLLCLRS